MSVGLFDRFQNSILTNFLSLTYGLKKSLNIYLTIIKQIFDVRQNIFLSEFINIKNKNYLLIISEQLKY